jgi:hypothetical protein
MPTLQDYCNEHIDALRAYNQANMQWGQYNVAPFNQIHQFAAVLGHIPPAISRGNIIQTFMDENYYLGFVMAMMWGNIRKTRAYQAFSSNPDIIDHVLRQVKDLIIAGQYEEAYNGFLGGQFHINGVGESFFTKILCFLSQSLDEPQNLLIYDRWTRLVHLHLMLDNNVNPNVFYTNNKIIKIATVGGVYADDDQRYNAYHHYCNSMAQLADALSNENHPISPFKLEAYLFGKSLKLVVNKNNHNPRFWYKNNFIHQYLPRFR